MIVRKTIYYIFAFGPILFLAYLFGSDAWKQKDHLGEIGNPTTMPYAEYLAFYGLLLISWLLFLIAAKIIRKRYKKRAAYVVTMVLVAAAIPIVVGYLINTYARVDVGVLAAVIPYTLLVLIISFVVPLRKRYY